MLTQDKSAPLIVVSGITGKQGGSVLAALEQSQKPYRVKGITRDASKPAAKKIADKGVEMVSLTLSADALDKTTEVLQGADYFFGVTDFWSHTDKQREISEGKMMADAAKKAGVTFLYSGLPSYEKISNGKYKNVDHFEGKYDIVQYAKQQGVKIISVEPAMYMQNYLGGLAPRKQEDGSYLIFTPQGFAKSENSYIDIENDYGIFVVAAIESGKFKSGDSILAVSEQLSGQQTADAMAKVSGKKVNIAEVPLDTFVQALSQQMGPTIALEFGEMLAAHWDVGYFGGASTKESLGAVSRKTETFEEFLRKNNFEKVLA